MCYTWILIRSVAAFRTKPPGRGAADHQRRVAQGAAWSLRALPSSTDVCVTEYVDRDDVSRAGAAGVGQIPEVSDFGCSTPPSRKRCGR